MRAIDHQDWIGTAKALNRIAVTHFVLTIVGLVFGWPTYMRVTIAMAFVATIGGIIQAVRASRRYRRRWTNVDPGDPPLDSVERAARER